MLFLSTTTANLADAVVTGDRFVPILDASILDTDPEGARRLREVLGPARREPEGRAAMRAAAERQQRSGSERTERQRESDAALARAIRHRDEADSPARRFHPFG